MVLSQLQVVLWKNLKIRKRHWFVTICESLLPALLFIIIVYIRSKVPHFQKNEILEPTFFPEISLDYDGIDTGLTHILYNRENDPFYREIIYRTSVRFQIPNDHIRGFNSEESLLKYYYKNHNDTVIAIIFKGTDRKRFDYTLRYHEEQSYHEFLQTSRLYSDNQFEPNYESNYLYKGVLSLQKTLDLSFIELSLGKTFQDNVNVSLLLKKFPFPPYTEDNGLEHLLRQYLPSFTLLSFIFICPAILQRVVEEKNSGIKELMKMVGMKSWMLWLGWFINGMIPMMFASCYIVFLLKVPLFGSEYPVIEYTDGSIIFCFLLLYCMAANVFCFAISTAFKKPAIAMVTGLLIWILSYLLPKYCFGLDEPVNLLSWSDNMLFCLLPNMVLHYGYAAMSSYEEREIGVQWTNFVKSGSGGSDDVTMFNVFAMLIVDIVFYWCITFYIDAINPGKYGVGKPLSFPLKWIWKRFSTRKISVINGTESAHLKNIEDGGDNKIGIEILSLYKKFEEKVAVDNLKLDIYKNQITVLLGHNGAGKSTTMSMITAPHRLFNSLVVHICGNVAFMNMDTTIGRVINTALPGMRTTIEELLWDSSDLWRAKCMLKPDNGSITINGMNIKDNMDEIRNSLGLCPQHNLLFTDLTVKEHLVFFAKLKGKTTAAAEIEADVLLKKLNLLEKKNELAPNLSGGMKRKLCLGMAVIGGSKVLILDEPSSGMDPESRRELWDLLLKWRGEKTILITTHFMEEADALGDWIAIMTDGQVTCYGTPLYLKKKYNTGYHLSIMFKDDSEKDKRACIDIVTREIPKCQVKSQAAKNLVFVVPFENNHDIASLLTLLEKDEYKEELGIDNIYVTITTLEDVYLKTQMYGEGNNSETTDTSALLDSDTTDFKNPPDLQKPRILALVGKRFKFLRRRIIPYGILTTISMLFFIATVLLSANTNDFYKNNGPELKFKVSSYKKTSVYFNGSSEASELLGKYKQIVEEDGSMAIQVPNVEDAILIKGIENVLYYKEHTVVGAQFSNKNNFIKATALFNIMAIHSAPISLNLLTNSMAKLLLGDDYSITTSNWPLETIDSFIAPVEYAKYKVVLLWTVLVPLGCLFLLASFILFPHIEIITKFVQLQYMCGVSPFCYWVINFATDMLIYLATIVPLAVLISLLSSPFRGFYEAGTLLFIYIMYGMCGIPSAYLFSRKKSASGAFSAFIILGLFLGEILALVLIILTNSGDPYYENIGENAKIVIFLFIPHVNLVYTLFQFSEKVVSNYNMEVSSKRMQSLCSFNPNPCCYGKGSECAAFKAYLPMMERNLGLMLATCALYMFLTILIDTYFVRKILSQGKLKIVNIFNCTNKNKHHFSPCKVIKERSEDDKYKTLNVKKLQKTYSGKAVVNNIDITLNHGACLGILGVNGAGKTTTFRMLTREEIVDNGTIEVKLDEDYIDISKSEYLNSLGYCPQIDALNYVLTGREILQIIANLRGVYNPEVVTNFLKAFELDKYENIPCGHYSGGNKRKLSLAVALIGYRNIVLLDEPTNGVDPSARRKCWELIKTVQRKKNTSFILTSHSMMECEALCDDLKIMKNGTFYKQGTISKLKHDIEGFSLKLKLKNKNANVSNPTDVLINVKSETNSRGSHEEFSNDEEGYDVVDSVPSHTTDPLLPISKDSNEFKFKNREELMNYFKQKGELRDEHSGLLHFYIKDQSKRWSTIFREVEQIKEANPDLIEDYAISEASLEDVFLNVARSE